MVKISEIVEMLILELDLFVFFFFSSTSELFVWQGNEFKRNW